MVENNGGVETIFLQNYTTDQRPAECFFEMLVQICQEWSIANR